MHRRRPYKNVKILSLKRESILVHRKRPQYFKSACLLFLGALFVRSFTLAFQFTGSGYWQELIEFIVWTHNPQHRADITEINN